VAQKRREIAESSLKRIRLPHLARQEFIPERLHYTRGSIGEPGFKIHHRDREERRKAMSGARKSRFPRFARA
jgi:hypothetical protein